MDRQDGGYIDEPCKRRADDVVEVQDVDRLGRVVNGPGCMVAALQAGRITRRRRPLSMAVEPPELARDVRIAVGVHDCVMAALDQTFGQMRYKQFGPAVSDGRHWNERR